MSIVPLPRKRLRFCIEEGVGDDTRMMVASVEIDSREALRLLGYLADLME